MDVWNMMRRNHSEVKQVELSGHHLSIEKQNMDIKWLF